MAILQTNRARISAAAAATALLAGGFFALDFGPGIALDSFTASDNIDVTGAPADIAVTVGITSTDDIRDTTVTFSAPGVSPRSCVSYTPDSGDAKSGVWSCNITLPANIAGGTWSLVNVVARDVVAGEKLDVTAAEIIAAGDVDNGAGGFVGIADTQVTVASSTPDSAGPSIAIAPTPNSFLELFGGTTNCVNTATDANGVRDAGCTLLSSAGVPLQSCVGTKNVDEYSCNLSVPPGSLAYNVSGFARDTIGNRSYDPATITMTAGGLTPSECTTDATGNGLPLAIDLDSTGDAWVLGEFHTHIQHISDNSPTACGTSDQYLVPNGGGNVFWQGNSNSGQSVLGEGVAVDKATDKVYFSQGGGIYECDNDVPATPPCTDVNHSRVGEFTPGPNTFKLFNLPGNRNEAHGVHWDEARGWVWVAEGGFYSDFVAGDVHQGTLLAFDPDLATWNNSLSSGSWSTIDNEICSGGVGDATPADGCMQRFQLPANAWNTAHMVTDSGGFVWFTNFWGTNIGRLDPSDGSVLIYPEPAPRSSQNPVVGSGTWAIKVSPDGLYVVWNEYFDNQISRMPIARWNDSACLSLDGNGANPCMEHINIPVDIATESTQGLAYAPNGALLFSTGTPSPYSSGLIQATLGFVDPNFTHATLLDPDTYGDYNPSNDISFKDMVVNPDTCTIWVSMGPGPSPANPGVLRLESSQCPGGDTINVVMAGTVPNGTPFTVIDSAGVEVASGTAPQNGAVAVTGTAPYHVQWGWSDTDWPLDATDAASFPLGTNGPYTSDSKAVGSTFTATYQARPVLSKSQLRTGMNIPSDNPYNGTDIWTDSARYRTSNAAITPDWNAIWPTTAAKTEIRPIAPASGEQNFWIFWEGAGDVTITRLGGVGVEFSQTLGAGGEIGIMFPMNVDHDLDTGNGTVAQLDVGAGTLSNIEIVHESYLGGAGLKCHRCIPGPDADGWYWQKGSDTEDDAGYCAANCSESNFVTDAAKDMAKYLRVSRFLSHVNDVNRHPSSECSDWGDCGNTLDYHGSGRNWTDDMFDSPFQRAFTYESAYQAQINLCNAMQTDCWFTIPYWENAAFQTALIAAIENGVTGLDDGLVAYVEYGNELWNYGTPYTYGQEYASHRAYHEACIDDAWTQNGWLGLPTEDAACVTTPGFADLETKVEGLAGVSYYDPQYRYASFRMQDFASEWWTAYGPSGSSKYATKFERLRPVIGVWAANPGNTRLAFEQESGADLSFDGGTTTVEDWVYGFATAYYPGLAHLGNCGIDAFYTSGADSEYWAYSSALQADLQTHWIDTVWSAHGTSDAFTRGFKWLTYEGGSMDWNPSPGGGCTGTNFPNSFYKSLFTHPTGYVNGYDTLAKLDASLPIELFMEYQGPAAFSNAENDCSGTPCAQYGYFSIRDTMREPIADSTRYQGWVDAASTLALACAPADCASAGYQCGTGHDDGCLGTFDCGTAGACGVGETCNGAFQCVPAAVQSVVSVERIPQSMAVDTGSATTALTKSQVTANSVPFVTVRSTTPEATADRWAGYMVRSYFSGSDLVSEVGRGSAAIDLETTVVEFDGTTVKVQSGTSLKSSIIDATATLSPAVDQSKAFLYFTYDNTNGSADASPYSGMVRGYISSPTEVTFTQSVYSQPLEITWYVVEAQNAEFTVEEFDIVLSAVASNSATIATTDTTQTLLVGSYTADSSTNDDNNLLTIDVTLDDATTVTASRAGTAGVVSYTGYAIEFPDGGPTVQRGTLAQSAATASENVDFTTPLADLDWAMVHGSGQGHRQNGSFPGTGSSDHADAYATWDFVDTDTVVCEHNTSGGEAAQDLSWEVIDWRFSGGAGGTGGTGGTGGAVSACDGFTPDYSASATWSATQAETPTSSTLVVDYYARPSSLTQDALVAFAEASPIDNFTNAAMLVRFRDGLIDVYDGTGYGCKDIACPAYVPDQWYHFVINANVGTGLYTVQYETCDDGLVTISTDAAFRATAPSASIGYHAARDVNGDTIDVDQVTWTPGACTPLTCGAAPRECGAPDDGCGTPLSCGACAGGDVCYPEGTCCTPLACANAGPGGAAATCGTPSDGCGGTLSSCGTCSDPNPTCSPSTFTCGPAPVATSQPTPANTGPHDRSSLQTWASLGYGSQTVTVSGQVFENFIVSSLSVEGDNNTFRNCVVDGSSNSTGYLFDFEYGAEGNVIEDCELIGGKYSFFFHGNNNTMRRVHVHDSFSDSGWVAGDDTTIEYSLVHLAGKGKCGTSAHIDMPQVGTEGTAERFVMQYNTFEGGTCQCPGSGYKNSNTLLFENDHCNNIPRICDDMILRGNWINGSPSGVLMNGSSKRTVLASDNRFGTYFGATSTDTFSDRSITSGKFSWGSGNVWDCDDSAVNIVSGKPSPFPSCAVPWPGTCPGTSIIPAGTCEELYCAIHGTGTYPANNCSSSPVVCP